MLKKILTNKLLSLVGAVLLVATAQLAAERSHLHWVITNGMEVDKVQAERLYTEACRFVEDQFDSEEPVRPFLTIHVGQNCPDSDIAVACLSLSRGELFIPAWDDETPNVITNATLVTAVHQIMDKDGSEPPVRLVRNHDSRRGYTVASVGEPHSAQ